MKKNIKSSIILSIAFLSETMCQSLNQTSTCLCTNDVLMCNTPGNFNYTVSPSNQEYYIQSNFAQSCVDGILFQSTEGITYNSQCPKGSNGKKYEGTHCESNPPDYGKKSLIYAQMSNSNANLKCQSGNTGHLMKQWCGLMIWQGNFYQTRRCQDYVDELPILLDGEPLPIGSYTQTAVCPSVSWPNGYVELGGTGTVVSMPFISSSLVWIPIGSSNYEEFQKAMIAYNSGQSFSMSANMATLLNGNQVPQGPCSSVQQCSTTQIQGQQFQPPSVLQSCQITAAIETNTKQCYQMSQCTRDNVGTYVWNNYTMQLSLEKEACQTQQDIVVSQNTTVPTNSTEENMIVFKSSTTSCNFSFRQQQGYQFDPEQHCYFAATDPIAGNLTDYNVTKKGFAGLSIDLFGNFFRDIMIIFVIVVVLVILCCIKDFIPKSQQSVVVRQTTDSAQLNQQSSKDHHMVAGLMMMIILIVNIYLWCTDIAWPEWEGLFITSLCFYTITTFDVLTQRSQIYSFYTISACSVCLTVQIVCNPYLTWLCAVSGFIIILKMDKVDGNALMMSIAMMGFEVAILYYGFYWFCSNIGGYLYVSIIVLLSWVLSYQSKNERILSMSVIIVTVQMPVATQNTLQTICEDEMSYAFSNGVIGLQIVVSVFCLLRSGTNQSKPNYQSFINEGLDMQNVMIADDKAGIETSF